METRVHEIADGVYRLSTFIDGVTADGFVFNQFLIDADEPMLFHTGLRGFFPLISAAVARVMPLERLRWISFGHVEADECGAMNSWLAAAPNAQVVFGQLGCDVSLNDLADRPPRAMANGEALDIGGRRMRWIDTPHVPHGWEAGVFFDETHRVMFSGDLMTHGGDGAAISDAPILERALAFEAAMPSMSQHPHTAQVLRELAVLGPTTLALMHGGSFRGDGAGQLNAFADWCADQQRALA
jgi:flavorubredoxin